MDIKNSKATVSHISKTLTYEDFDVDSSSHTEAIFSESPIPARSSILALTYIVDESFHVPIGRVYLANNLLSSSAFDATNLQDPANISRNLSHNPLFTGLSTLQTSLHAIVIGIGFWSTIASMNGLVGMHSCCGATSSCLSFGGRNASYNALNKTEIWNDVVWSTSDTLNVAKSLGASAGSLVAGLSYGGVNGSSGTIEDRTIDTTEEYALITWTVVNTMNVARSYHSGTGSQLAAVACGGYAGSSLFVSTETYNGTTWATDSDANLLASRRNASACGTQMAAVLCGGWNSSAMISTEEFNGTIWSTGGDMNILRYGHASSGNQTDAIAYGGRTTSSITSTIGSTEVYNSSNVWSVHGHMITQKSYHGGDGSYSAALSSGGIHKNSEYTNEAEIFYGSVNEPSLLSALTSGSITINATYVTYE